MIDKPSVREVETSLNEIIKVLFIFFVSNKKILIKKDLTKQKTQGIGGKGEDSIKKTKRKYKRKF